MKRGTYTYSNKKKIDACLLLHFILFLSLPSQIYSFLAQILTILLMLSPYLAHCLENRTEKKTQRKTNQIHFFRPMAHSKAWHYLLRWFSPSHFLFLGFFPNPSFVLPKKRKVKPKLLLYIRWFVPNYHQSSHLPVQSHLVRKANKKMMKWWHGQQTRKRPERQPFTLFVLDGGVYAWQQTASRYYYYCNWRPQTCSVLQDARRCVVLERQVVLSL